MQNQTSFWKCFANCDRSIGGLFSKTASIVALALGFLPPHTCLAAEQFKVVVFGDSLLDAGTYTPVAESLFDGGRYTTNPGLNFTEEVARHLGDRLTPAFVGGFGRPLRPREVSTMPREALA